MIILEHVPFSDEQFYRLLQNCSIDLKSISTPAAFDGGRYDICALYIERTCKDVSQLMDFAGQLHNKFDDQFKHNSKVRRICTNPNCKSKYAYFYEDFLYCPKCGTKLITTRNDAEDFSTDDMKEFNIQLWIPVIERLPSVGKEVYVTDGEYIARANLLDEVFPGDQPCWSYSGIGEPTYWCEKLPLPKSKGEN